MTVLVELLLKLKYKVEMVKFMTALDETKSLRLKIDLIRQVEGVKVNFRSYKICFNNCYCAT